MMKIPVEKHIKFCNTEFTEFELLKIIEFVDSKYTELYSKNRIKDESMEEDSLIWEMLVRAFLTLHDAKKTKAFIYQMLVVNGMVDDGLEYKFACGKRARGECLILNNKLKALGREWERDDYSNICCNLGICTILPEKGWFNMSRLSPDLKEVELDDSIILKKVNKK